MALYILLYACVACLFLTALAFAWYTKDLPTPSKIANRKATESTKIYDRTGQTLLYETGEQKRTIVRNDQISPYLKDATISVEDQNFYKHHGFDTKAVLSAIVGRLTGKSTVVRGGSTITQQYVKNALLTSDRSMSRKIKELILSVELEMMYSKDEILTMYLNEIPYGNSTAGAEAASRLYYGKAAKDLTLSEAATLAAIPKAPTYYSPYGTHTPQLISRKDYVLDRMVSMNKVSKEDADKAKAEDTTTIGMDLKKRSESLLAPHFAMYVLEDIANKYGEEKVQKEGLKVITTLDYDKQKIAEAAVKSGEAKFTKYGASNGALVATDPKTGQILAMVGSKDYFNQDIDGNVNVTDSLRQPGSSFKPFAYATAFKDKEYSPSKILFDVQTDFGGGYVPRNYNGRFNGPVTMRTALSNSLNIPAVKALALAGIDNTLRTAEDMGITTLTQRDRYGLSLVLGAGEVKPVEMAGAFGVFANNGVKKDLTPVLKISDSSGKTLYDYDKEKDKQKQALDPQVAYEIANILSDNNARALVFGTRSALAFSDRTVAAKTGTTSSFKDAWTVGFTPSIAVAVWVGNNDSATMSSGADGSVVAAPIFHEFIVKALANTPNEEFARPAEIQTVTVDKFSNRLPNSQSPETTTDIFASWQVPTEQDNIHVKVRVCKANGLLAPDGMPADLTEEKTFTQIHSEKPDNANWENPVIAWAQANGMNSAPPKDYCDASKLVPTVSIDAPQNNATVSGATTLIATGGGGSGVKSIEFFVDDVSIGMGSASGNTYTLSYNFSTLSNATHKITAVVTDNSGVTASASINVTVEKGAGSVTMSDPSVSSITNNSATVSWTTGVPATSEIFYGTSADTLTGHKINGSMDTAHAISITGLSSNTTYYFKVVSMDGSSNTGTSAIKSFKTL